MKRVLISGYYGFGNTGDEAILEMLSSELTGRGIQVSVLSAAPEETEKRYNIKAFNRFKFGQIIKAIKNCDGVISGGGSLFQDVTSSFSLYYYLGIILLAKIMGKKVYVYSQGIGPINKDLNKKIFTVIINMVKLISVRDKASFEELSRLKVKVKDISITGDPVFVLKPASIKRGREILVSSGIDIGAHNNLIGIAVRAWGDKEKASDEFAKIADKIIEVFNAKLVFFTFHYPHDLDFTFDIINKMKNKPFILDKQYMPSEVMSAMGLMNINIGVRLHSLIFSAKMGVPVVGISYDPKIDGLLNTIGFKPVCKYENLEWNKVQEAILNINDNRANVLKKLNVGVKQNKKLAQKTLENFWEELNK